MNGSWIGLLGVETSEKKKDKVKCPAVPNKSEAIRMGGRVQVRPVPLWRVVRLNRLVVMCLRSWSWSW